MKMWKALLISVVGIFLSFSSYANNVKIVGDVKVSPSDITDSKMATFSFKVEWENSWRDEFNYDAVYVFLKYKLDENAQEWNHLYLNDLTVDNAYECELMNPTGAANRNVGVMIWRKGNSFGKAEVTITAKWDITSNSACPLQSSHFEQGKVFMSAMAIEMVHVPQVAFRVGDSKLKSKTDSLRFRHRYLPIPSKWDLVSDNYSIDTKNNKETPGFLPKYAANRTNDVDRTHRTNAWVGDGSAEQFWRIDFGTKDGKLTGETKTVRYFAIEGVTGYVPEVWQLIGRNALGQTNPDILYEGTAADWVTTSSRVYPATKALRIKVPKAYRYYEINIKTLGAAQGPAIKTVSMTEKELTTDYDNSVLIQEPVLKLSDAFGASQNIIYTNDGDITGGVTITNAYPHGFYGFFAMKYEISQEQYVAFLNKLNLAQQNVRSVGEKLISLKEGQYVFGETPETASARNGIILASRTDAVTPLVFANNLNKADGEYAQDGDGQTLACNYLTPADMLAYADWTGLRPMTELEYEKMARQPYPAVLAQGGYAWSSTTFTPPASASAITNPGKRSESLSSGNANGGNVLPGPVRCGAFGKTAGTQQASGVSFWGFADMSGNLAEIYYNLNTEGRKFAGLPRSSHGDGSILSKTGESDINAGIWPINGNAFALRGGSYKSTATELEIADRSRGKGNYEPGLINARKSDVTFRVGCSMEKKALTSVVTLENGLKSTATAGVADTICSGVDYVLRGDIPAGIEGAYTILWYYAGNNDEWYHIEGENGKDLYLKNLRNANTADNVFTEYRYKRHIYSSQGYAFSQPIVLRVVNTQVEITPREISVGVAATSSAITVKSKLPMTVKWHFKTNPMENLRKVITANKAWEHTPMYNDFTYAGVVNSGKQPLTFYHVFYDKFCPATDTVWVDVQKTDGSIASSDAVICGQPFIDDRDGTNTYNTVGIGTQCWMVENLNYAQSGSKCYEDNENNCRVYGRLYNWTQATKSGAVVSGVVPGVCPKGWHLPNNAEWTGLANTFNGSAIRRQDWNGGSNTSGFSALPSGAYIWAYQPGYETKSGITTRTSNFYDVQSRAWWWTSTQETRDAYWYLYNYNNSYNAIENQPYYVRLDGGNLIFLEWVAYAHSGYLNNSIFAGNHYYHIYSNPNNPSYDNAALVNMRSEFYMSVRCVRDRALQADEKK